MPVLTSAGSDSDSSQPSGHLDGGHPELLSRHSLLLLICILTAAIAALYLCPKVVLPRFTARRPGHHISGNSCPPRVSASWISSDSKKPDITSSWAQARQGQGHLEKQASWAISRGETSGTAPVGLGGPFEGRSLGSMEQEEKTTHTGSEGSRGVSNDSSYAAGQESSGLPYPGFPPFPAAAEESGHVRTSSSLHHPPPLGGAGDDSSDSAEQAKDSMDGDLVARHWGYGGLMTTDRSTSPSLGHPYAVADDLGVTYYPDGGFDALPNAGRRQLPLQQHPEPDSTRQSQSRSRTTTKRATSSSQRGHQKPFENRRSSARYSQSSPAELEAVAIDSPGSGSHPAQTPGYIMGGTSPDTETYGEGSRASSSHYSPSSSSSMRRSFTRNIPIPAGADGSSPTGPTTEGYHGWSPLSSNTFSPSSYPPASPLLPPPPISDYPFDPAAVMFPGPGAVDGGVRVVYMDHDHDHDHEDDGHGDAAGAYGHSGGSSWTRHTRVYGGGGVCLACAAAGGGGFYGARVRPEDKR